MIIIYIIYKKSEFTLISIDEVTSKLVFNRIENANPILTFVLFGTYVPYLDTKHMEMIISIILI